MQQPSHIATNAGVWQPDRLLPGFEALELPFPDDYDGPVVATLVRYPVVSAPNGPVLYVHGFIDYFFQRETAERFAQAGYAFHALDLRKHGRSLRPHQHPNFCRSIREYYADLTEALRIIGEPTVLVGHSTGGLVCSLYAHEGERRAQLTALWLNSPFFDFKLPPWRRALLAVGARVGRVFPFLNDPRAVSPDYPKSLHKHYRGEWEFDLRLKPIRGFPAYYGWLAAIREAQARVRRGLDIRCPVLSTYSDEADIVLDWRHMERWSRVLGPDVTLRQFPGALHDVVLSRKDIREAVYAFVLDWLAAHSRRTG
ncbi:MAG TPA: alpha/beta hydrolase [Burkholderiales bacterium]